MLIAEAPERLQKKSGGLLGAIASVFTGKKNAVEPPKVAKSMPKARKQEKERFNRQGRKFKHQIDTNVIALNLKVLKEDAELAAGDPIFCKACNAVFNMFSKLEEKEKRLEDIKEEDEEMPEEGKEEVEMEIPNEREEELKLDDGDHIWKCEFCGHKNVVSIEKEEIPTKDAINYILDTEEIVSDKKKQGEQAIIFCVDISGSM